MSQLTCYFVLCIFAPFGFGRSICVMFSKFQYRTYSYIKMRFLWYFSFNILRIFVLHRVSRAFFRICNLVCLPIPVAERFKAWVCGRLIPDIVGSNAAGGMYVCLLWVLSGRGLCDELITRPEESYRLWFVVVCDLEASRIRRPWPVLGRSATEKFWFAFQSLWLDI